MADGLKLALFGLHRGGSAEPDTLVRRARRAEEVGFESFWIGDHIALPSAETQGGDPPAQPRLEAVVALAYMAALTSRVRLAIGVIVLPQRQPVLLAKQLSTIDVLSKGRLIVGIGVGYLDPELRALGASLADRGARTDEYLAVMRALWGEPTPSFSGRFVSFSDVIERPRPVQRPHPPIVIGGHSPAAYRRAIQVGNGWHGWDLDPEQTAQALAALRETEARYGRPAGLGKLEITITPRGTPDVDTARRYADLGVHRLAIQPHTMDGSAMDELITLVGKRSSAGSDGPARGARRRGASLGPDVSTSGSHRGCDRASKPQTARVRRPRVCAPTPSIGGGRLLEARDGPGPPWSGPG